MTYPERDQDGLPVRINLGDDESMPVRQKHAMGGLGCLDLRTEPEIVIEADQPKVGKHQILLHELIHTACEGLKSRDIIRRQPSELMITHISAALFNLLAANGLWNGVTLEEFEEYQAKRT